MAAKCQICDGPIVNGRCKFCGMPYRNDEVMYHLNENRTDHYRHATPKAKEMMKKQEVPLSDRKVSSGRTASKEELKAQQAKIRQEAVKRMTTTKTPAPVNTRNTGKKSAQGSAGSLSSSARSSVTSAGIKLLILAVLLFVALRPDLKGYIADNYSKITEKFSGTTGLFSADAEEFSVWEDSSGNLHYSLGSFYGEITVGEELEPGTYKISVEKGSATIQVANPGKVQNYGIEDKDSSKVIFLSEGDRISVVGEPSAGCVLFENLNN